MKIKHIQVVPRDIPLKEKFSFASYELTYLPYAWVRVETECGLVGYGECPSYWDPSGETQQSAIGALTLLTPHIIGLEAYDLESIFYIFDSLAYGAFSAKCGLDMALYDIIGQKLGVSVYKLLGGGSARVRVNAVIPLRGKDSIEDKINQLIDRGFSTFKIKVGIDLNDELELVRQIMHLLPPACIVFLDANQAWRDAKTAIRAINQFEDLGVQWVEQPILAQDIEGLRLVRQSVKVSIIADESVYTSIDALNLISRGATDMINIKLAKSGGMYLGKKMLAVAQAGNIPCMLGSMVESSLGMLANYHFAKAHQMVTCGLSAYTIVDENAPTNFRLTQGELSLFTEHPGLGYEDAGYYEHYFTEQR